MNTADINTKLIDSYVGLLKNLSISNKLDLISRLTQSLKSDMDKGNSFFLKLMVLGTVMNLLMS